MTPHIVWALGEGERSNLRTSELVVLMVLAEMANGARLCWPSLPCLARKTRQSARTCHTAVHKLAALNLIRMEPRGVGNVMHYHILRPADVAPDPAPAPVPAAAPDPDPIAAVGIHSPEAELMPPEPLQPLQGVALEPLQLLQGVTPLDPVEPLQPLQGDPCKSQQMTLAMVASKPLKKEEPLKKGKKANKTRGRARFGEREDAFQTFYELYPRKRAPDAARRALDSRLDAGVPLDEILDGLRRHVFASQERYIPHPASWLNSGQWKDETFDRNTQILRAAGLIPGAVKQPSGWDLLQQ